VITGFSTEGGALSSAAPSAGAVQPAAKPSAPAQIANRFVAFYIDDLVMGFDAISRSRTAALNYLKASLKPTDRVGIYTSSGQGNLDFTPDRAKLQAALARLQPNGFLKKGAIRECPDLSDYEAYQIDELHDRDALAVATQKVIDCECGGDARICQNAASLAQFAARRVWSQAESQARYSLRGLQNLVRRLSVLPGQRVILFVSPGFLSESQLQMISEIVDRAVRAGVVVNSLDPRGLYTVIPGGDATHPGQALPAQLEGMMVQMQTAAIQADSGVLAEMADGTGGVYFHTNNDLEAGFREAGGLAEFSYVLVFSPNPLKLNGKYHHLTVRLAAPARARGLTLQARRGYFAPRSAPNSAQAEKDELYNSLYSRDELNSSLLRLATRFYKSSPTEAHVTIVAHLDSKLLTFRSENGRHTDDVTFVTVLFDSDGNFVQGLEKQLIMNLRDATLEKMRSTGISISDDFPQVPPGTYLVREIVKDQGGMLSSANDTLEIPN
jgi:VWFA-related protein